MKRGLTATININRFRKWSLLTIVIIIAVSLSGCNKEIASSPANTGITNKANWTTYTDANTVTAVLAKGNDLWAATEGGVVKWNMNTGAYQKYTTSDGLSYNNTGGMTQDKSGNLWFVTGGITKYDGKSWQNLPPVSASLDIGISSIAVDDRNNIYAGMSDCSIYRYNGAYQQIKTPEEPPNSRLPLGRQGIFALAVDRDNNLWSVASDGIKRYDGKSWVNSHDIPGFPDVTIDFIGVDKNNDLWFQSYTDFASAWLYRYDGVSWQKIGIQFTDSTARSITIDKQGNLWCATLGTLQRYNGKTWQTFTCPVVGIDSIAADNNGNIWCGAYQHGLLRFDGNSWKTYLTNDISEMNYMVFIAGDNDGNIWFDTGKGLSRFDGKNWEMVNKDMVNATCFLQDKPGNLWFGSWNHVIRYDGTSWDIFSPDSQTYITSIKEDNTGNVWVSTTNFLYRFDGQLWTSFDVRDIFGVTRTNIQINSVSIDNQNTVWAATTSGILHFDGTNWKIYTTADGLADNYIAGFIQDKSGDIWAYGFYSGLNLFDGSSWQSFLKDDRIVAITQDNDGNMWLATNHGVIKYDGSAFQRYTTADGLLDDSIHAIAIDHNNDVWCGTDYGVNYFNGKTWLAMTTIQGLAGNQTLQIVTGQSGDIWFSSFGGVSRYHPTVVSQSAIPIELNGPAPVNADQLTAIVVTPAPVYTLAPGVSQQYLAMGTYFDAMRQNITAKVTWTSSNTAVAAISGDGLATGMAAGTTVITATLSGITGPAVTLNVIAPQSTTTSP